MKSVAHAVRIDVHGETEVMQVEQVELSLLKQGEVRVRNEACGVNFIDTYQRGGLYPLELPAILGNEAAGVIEEMGSDVTGFKVGQKVAYCTVGIGCYASHRNVPADKLVALPDEISCAQAASCLLKGLTAEYLARRCWPVVTGTQVMVLAAAGGVGSILCQWLSRLGAHVIGVVGSASKRDKALENCCDEVIVGYTGMADLVRANWPSGVQLVLDSVGADTWKESLDCLAPRGCLVSYGNASGPAPALAPLELAQRGSLYLTRPVLAHYTATAAQLREAASALFAEIKGGLRLPEVTVMPLAEVAAAHRLLESRSLEGVLVLEPQAVGGTA